MDWFDSLRESAYALWVARVVLTGVAVLALHVAVFRVLRHVTRRSIVTTLLLDRAKRPARVLVVVIGAFTTLPGSELSAQQRGRISHALLIAAIAAGAWLAVAVSGVVEQAVRVRYAFDVVDNLQARRVQTQVSVLRRIVVFAIVVIAAAAILLTFDRARALGTSVLASAGVLGIVVGVAAQSTLANLVAGVQIALTEPIRLDDVVVVEGEWGRIEELTLSYVVVRLWDQRRLVLPISYFVQNPFENWTRRSAEIIGDVTLRLDFTTDVDALRHAFDRHLRATPRWDGNVATVQVTDADERTMTVRMLVSASDASTAFDLRCEVREAMFEYLRDQQPWALPRGRDELLSESSGIELALANRGADSAR
jgi:small-conductance mechanosensitive channel